MALKRLLIVDDEQALLDLLAEHFQGRYEVETVTSGAAALERFVRQRPDAVFLDVNMPGTNGVEVLKRLKQTDPAIPVVMVTANGETGVAEACLKHGAMSYVPKPFNLVYLDHIAAMAVEQRRDTRRH